MTSLKCIKERLHRVFTPKIVISAMPKRNLMVVLSYLGKRLLQICTRNNCAMKNKLPYCNLEFLFQTKCNLIIFSHLKIKFLFSYVPRLFMNLGAVAAMLHIMAKLKAILKSESVNTLEFLFLMGRKLKGIKNPPFFCN